MGKFKNNDKQTNTISDLAKSMTDHLGYPHKVFPKGTDYKTITKEYFDAAKRGKKAGFTPVLVPADDVLEDFFSIMEDDGYDAKSVLQEGADAEKGKQFLDERFEEYFADVQDDFDMSYEEFIGEYDGDPECLTGFSSLFDMSNNTAETILFEVPTTNPWEVAAYVPFGGWNECPDPSDMVNVLKYWFDRYGAVPATITHDTLEMLVPAPADESAALELAKEHYAFTPDRVDQGTESGTLSEVAESLKVSTVWFFWWD